MSFESTNKFTSHMALNSTPSLTLKPMVWHPSSFAVFNASTPLALAPPMLIPITKSPFCASALT